ncbi:MAG: 3'-5' exonuclease [Bacteroidales bacterium]
MNFVYEEMDKEAIRELQLYRYEGETVVVDNGVAAKDAIEILARASIIGFDTEHKPSFKKGENHPVSLIQMAIREKVFLFRVNKLKLPNALITIFENKEIIKVGVGLEDDFNGLQKLKPFKPRGFVDLSKYFQFHNYKQSSLKYLAAMVLNIRISKNQQVSNWEREQLSPSQIKYAATDAWIPRELYLALLEDGNYADSMTQ